MVVVTNMSYVSPPPQHLTCSFEIYTLYQTKVQGPEWSSRLCLCLWASPPVWRVNNKLVEGRAGLITPPFNSHQATWAGSVSRCGRRVPSSELTSWGRRERGWVTHNKLASPSSFLTWPRFEGLWYSVFSFRYQYIYVLSITIFSFKAPSLSRNLILAMLWW